VSDIETKPTAVPPPPPQHEDRPIVVETRGLTKVYRTLTAVRELDLVIRRGDVYGFIGPNGAGKTTTIKMCATLLPPTRGEATVAGYSVKTHPNEVRRRIGYMPDDFGVYDDMKVYEYLDFFAAAYRIRIDQRRKVISDVLELVDLVEKRDALIQTLSRGMRQRLGLSRVLLHDPDVLFLDEPASGLDPRARVEIRELLQELRRMGKTVLISSHILHELAELCNTIGIIEKGVMCYTGSVEDALAKVRGGRIFWVGVEREADKLVEFLDTQPDVVEVEQDGARVKVRLAIGSGDPATMLRAIIDGGFRVVHFAEQAVDLEDAFLQLTKGIVN
jgi:ABC-2 type transport system ATP-binding protein